MSAALKEWIHDDSLDQQYVDQWNNASLSERAKLLKEATRDPYLKHLAWAALDHLVRADVVLTIKRNQANTTLANKVLTPPNPNLWYNQERD